MTVHIISPRVRDAVAQTRLMRAAGLIATDPHSCVFPAWRFRREDVDRLTGGRLGWRALSDMGFVPTIGRADCVSIQCGEGPAAVVSRLMAAADRVDA